MKNGLVGMYTTGDFYGTMLVFVRAVNDCKIDREWGNPGSQGVVFPGTTTGRRWLVTDLENVAALRRKLFAMKGK